MGASAAAFALCAAMPCAPLACAAIDRLDTTVGLGPKGGLAGSIAWSPDGTGRVVLNGTLPPGDCITLRLYGPRAGEVPRVGPGKLPMLATVGASVHTFVVEIAPCAVREGRSAERVRVLVLPLNPDRVAFDPMRNSLFDGEVTVSRGGDPLQWVRPILHAGPGAPVGAGVEIRFYARVVPLADGARLQVADNEPLLDFALEWNGRTDYSGFAGGNALHDCAGNGWQVVETFLPRADFGLGLDPPIRAVAEIETARDGWRYCAVSSRVAAWN